MLWLQLCSNKLNKATSSGSGCDSIFSFLFLYFSFSLANIKWLFGSKEDGS